MSYVDTDLFVPAKSAETKSSLRGPWAIPGDAMVLLFVGSVVGRKGADILIRAFIGAGSQGRALHLLIVGPNTNAQNPSVDQDFVDGLHALLDMAGMAGRVSFTGLIEDRRSLANLYRASDIFVFPSNQEGLVHVVLEAMASGLPVVATRLPVLAGIIKHGQNGLLVPIGDPNALKDSLLALTADRGLMRRLGRAARDCAVSAHGFEAWQSQLAGIYRALLS